MAEREAYVETTSGRHVVTLQVDQDATDEDLRKAGREYLDGRGFDKGRQREHKVRLGRREVRL